jgi:hypothetical protein
MILSPKVAGLREGTVYQIIHRLLGEKLEKATSVIVPSKKLTFRMKF